MSRISDLLFNNASHNGTASFDESGLTPGELVAAIVAPVAIVAFCVIGICYKIRRDCPYVITDWFTGETDDLSMVDKPVDNPVYRIDPKPVDAASTGLQGATIEMHDTV